MPQNDSLGVLSISDQLTGNDHTPSLHLTKSQSWNQDLANACRDIEELWRQCELPQEDLPAARRAVADFPLVIPPAVMARIRSGDLGDPILRQFVPLGEELTQAPGYSCDPLREQGESTRPAPGIIHKYHGRVLLMTTPVCAVHCRYCFRRHFPYREIPKGHDWWRPALDYVRADPTIREVICSGGDPLMMPDRQFGQLIDDIAEIQHVETVRIHTRMPIVVPSRLTPALRQVFQDTRLSVVIVTHANHPREFDAPVMQAIEPLREMVTWLNQAVLLRGVNDTLEVQIDLAKKSFAAGVLPYYLHVLDPVQGAHHFNVNDEDALSLWQQMHAQLPGYLLPKLVREEAGMPGKTWL